MTKKAQNSPARIPATPEGREKPRRTGADARSGPRPRGFLFAAILATVLLAIAWFSTDALQSRAVERNVYRVTEMLLADKLDPQSLELVKDTRTLRGKLRSQRGEIRSVLVEFATDAELDDFRKNVIERFNQEHPGAYLDPKRTPSNSFFWQILVACLPWLLFGFLIYFLFFRQLRAPGAGGNVLSFGRSRAKLATRDSTGITFADVAGISEAKEEVLEIIEFLKNPKKFQKLGGRIPRGVMLVGSPGTGKTLLAKAIAGEAEVPFYSICGSDFVEMFVGVGAARVRDLFRQARENSPCIIFLDEVDAVGRRRGSGLGGGHDEREQTLNAILVEMDGFDSDEGIILVAATNRPDVLDPALLRPGRFDREIVIELPDLKGREEILRVHARKVQLDASVDIHRIARGTPAFSGAELAALVNEAAIIAAMRNQEVVRELDLEEARDKIRWGRQKTSRTIMDEDKKIIAYHEAGHAVIAELLPDVEPVHKVTIIPRGMALGATFQLPERDRLHLARKQCIGNLMVLYAGRIAEDLFCGDVTAGASNDIERATELARRMVCEWGMSENVGPINYSESQETIFLGREVTRSRNHSEVLALRIDEEVRSILDDCYKSTEKLLRKHRDAVCRVAEALLVKETLTGEEIAALVEGRTLEAVPLPPAVPSSPGAAQAGPG
ncbi:MAG TPA: ATP-dependent zinc metalloprotease FtsH [Planctomycetota bacterium]|nr:ATP-dependent zinc metalloprotease FtsH [Planctomycetota bacterium]